MDEAGGPAVDPKQPLKGLVRPGRQSFVALFGDGSVRPIDDRSRRPSWRPPSTRGGEPAGQPGRRTGPEDRRPGGPKTPFEVENDLKQIALAMHNYHDANGHFPTTTVRDKDGKALLSWRVDLLPYIEQRTCTGSSSSTSRGTASTTRSSSPRCPRLQGTEREAQRGREGRRRRPGGKDTAVPAGRGDGQASPTSPTGRRTRSWSLRATDDEAVVWTKPDDLPSTRRTRSRAVPGPRVRGGDGGRAVGRVRGGAEPKTVPALFTRAARRRTRPPPGDEPADGAGRPAVPARLLPGGRRLSELEAAGVDLNKLRRFLRDGIGDQVGFHMHDAPRLFDSDLAGVFGGGGGDGPAAGRAGDVRPRLARPVPVRAVVHLDPGQGREGGGRVPGRARPGERPGPGRPAGTRLAAGVLDFYRVPFPEPHMIRCLVVKFFGLKWRVYWGRIGDGLYVANRPFILEDLAAAHAAGKKPTGEKGHALLRLRPENWNEVLPGYNLGWAEGNRAACHANLSSWRTSAAGGTTGPARRRTRPCWTGWRRCTGPGRSARTAGRTRCRPTAGRAGAASTGPRRPPPAGRPDRRPADRPAVEVVGRCPGDAGSRRTGCGWS